MTKLILLPMAFYVFYIWGLGILNLRARVKSVRSGQTPIKYFRAFEGEPPPERVLTISQHFDNQFQLPMLYLFTLGMHFAVGGVNALTLVLAWGFVLSRMAHTFVHLGSNRVQIRALAFIAGWMMVIPLWIQLLYFVFVKGIFP